MGLSLSRSGRHEPAEAGGATAEKKKAPRELFCVGRAPGMGDVGAKNTEGCATGTLEGIRKEVLGAPLWIIRTTAGHEYLAIASAVSLRKGEDGIREEKRGRTRSESIAKMREMQGK